MPGMHGQYRETPVGCVTGVLAFLLLSLGGWMGYMLFTRAPDPDGESLVWAYVLTGLFLTAGMLLIRKSFRKLRQNLRSNRIEKM